MVTKAEKQRLFLDDARTHIENRAYRDAYAALHPHRRACLSETQFWLLYGIALQFIGAVSEAEAAFRRLRSLNPPKRDVLARHGRLIADCGDFGAARILLFKIAGELPVFTECLIACARVAEVFGDTSFEVKAYKSILAKSPKHIEALTNLGNIKKKIGALNEAEESYRRGLSLNPRSAILHRNLSDLLARTLRNEETIEEMEHCVALAPHNPHFMSDLIFAQHYSSRYTADDLSRSAQLWGQQFGNQERIARRTTRDAPRPPLRIGLLSGSFRQHPVGLFGAPGSRKTRPRPLFHCLLRQSTRL